jgi:trk system potassium uptake protein TrkA
MPAKHYIVVGLGTFGSALAERLARNGCRVTGLDSSRERVDSVKDVLYEAVIGDATDREALEHLRLNAADAVFVSMGEDISRSLLATLHAKELGAKHIVVKGVTQEHGRILKRLGADRVVFPEIEIAHDVADRMTWSNVIDFLPIDPEYSFVEIAAPDAFIGKKLQELELKKRFNVWVVGLKDAMTGKSQMFPDGQVAIGVDQILFVVGKQEDLTKLSAVK